MAFQPAELKATWGESDGAGFTVRFNRGHDSTTRHRWVPVSLELYEDGGLMRFGVGLVGAVQ